jgi:hypothetical protein
MNSLIAKDFDTREKIYVLAEFPYPSGTGLHIGHVFTFTGADVYTRYQRMRGKNVLFPMGWDAFGLPTENFAIRTGRNPQEVTRENTETFKRQMQEPIPITTVGLNGYLSSCLNTAWRSNKRCRSTGALAVRSAWPTKRW